MWLLIGAVILVSPTAAASTRLDVRARTTINARTDCEEHASCVVRGVLQDDQGAPVSNRELIISFPDQPHFAAAVRPCAAASATLAHERTTTDSLGGFCWTFENAAMQAPRLRFAVHYAGAADFEASSTEVIVVPTLGSTNLEWLNPSNTIFIDQPDSAIELKLTVNQIAIAQAAVSLVLHEGDNRSLFAARATTDQAGIAKFNIPSQGFAHTGLAHIVAKFDGLGEFAPSHRDWVFTRMCRATVDFQNAHAQVVLGDPLTLSAIVQSNCPTSIHGFVRFSTPSVLGVDSPLQAGVAKASLSTERLQIGQYVATARLVPTSDLVLVDAPKRFAFRVIEASPLSKAIWLSLALVIFAYLAVDWRHRRFRQSGHAERPSPGTPESLIVETRTTSASGWTGVVIDSHTAEPIKDVRVTIEQLAFAAPKEIAYAQTDQSGAFSLPPVPNSQHLRLSASRINYESAYWRLPPPGKLTIRIASTRRAVLTRFASWAKESLTDRTVLPDLTPGQLAEAHASDPSKQIVTWARRIERAAFGPETIENAGVTELFDSPPTRPQKVPR